MRHLMLILLMLCAGPVQGAQSLVPGLQGGSVNVPNTAPFNSIGSCRWEWRMHNFTLNSPARQYVFVAAGILASIHENSTQLWITDFLTEGSPTLFFDLAGRTDILFRFTHNRQIHQATLEAWDSDGSRYVEAGSYPLDTGPENISGSFTVGWDGSGSRLQGRIAFLRWFHSILPLRSLPPGNIPAGDLLRYEFEGNGNDSSGRNLNLTFGSLPAYAVSPPSTLLPAPCNAAYDCTIRAGVPVAFDASPNQADTYFWQQIGGPSQVSWSNRTAAAPTVVAPEFGTYMFLLLTTSGGLPSAVVFRLGAVPTNDAGVVLVADDKVDFLLGPLLRNGVTEWTFYDYMRSKKGREWGETYAPQISQVMDSPLTGTLTATHDSSTILGGGTTFLSTFVCDGSDIIEIYHPLAGGLFGRTAYSVISCADDSTLTIGTPYAQVTGTGLPYQRLSDDAPGFQLTTWGSSINYYDSVLVQYQNYYRTGNDDYLRYARTLAEGWWRHWAIDEGRGSVINGLSPRVQSLTGLMLWALDNGPSSAMWPWIEATTDWHLNNWIEIRGADNGYTSPNYGVRDSGYAYLYAVHLAKVHPIEAVRNAYLTRVMTELTNYWIPFQCRESNPPTRCQSPDGSYRWTDALYWSGLAEQPWHTGIALESIANAHKLTGDARFLDIMERWVANQKDGNTGSPGFLPLWQTQASQFNSGASCRSVFYLHYAEPFAGILMPDAEGTFGRDCFSTDNLRDNRANNNEAISPFGYLASQRVPGYVEIQERGDDMFSATFARDTGPGADGYFGRMDYNYKQYGQSHRSAGGYLANRTGTVGTKVDYPLVVGFNLASVPGATQLRVTLRKPTGATVQSTCASSPCVVTADRRQGNHNLTLEYLSAAGKVLATSEQIGAEVAP